jgi:hypothetical protein
VAGDHVRNHVQRLLDPGVAAAFLTVRTRLACLIHAGGTPHLKHARGVRAYSAK